MKGSTNSPQRSNSERASNPKPQGDGNRPSMPNSAKYGSNNEGKCLAGSNVALGVKKWITT